MTRTRDVDHARHHGSVHRTLRTGEVSQRGHGPHHSQTPRKSKFPRGHPVAVAFSVLLTMVRAWQQTWFFATLPSQDSHLPIF